ncbi:MAG: hypothetical protein M0R80_09840 [Proteobacteria bacterium]|jgi:hypothetical protein|nr:hypothetical protein [Pseudomonadota bacterium]
MFDLTKLHKILSESTICLRIGKPSEQIEYKDLTVTEIWNMPHESDPDYTDILKIDVGLFKVGIIVEKAERNKQSLIDILDNYPDPKRLSQGPSYIEIGATLDSQEAAFRIAALGSYLEICDIISPMSLGITGDDAKLMIKRGLFMMIYPKRMFINGNGY